MPENYTKEEQPRGMECIQWPNNIHAIDLQDSHFKAHTIYSITSHLSCVKYALMVIHS